MWHRISRSLSAWRSATNTTDTHTHTDIHTRCVPLMMGELIQMKALVIVDLRNRVSIEDLSYVGVFSTPGVNINRYLQNSRGSLIRFDELRQQSNSNLFWKFQEYMSN